VAGVLKKKEILRRTLWNMLGRSGIVSGNAA